MILNHECFECGFKGEVKVSNRKVVCPNCNTINDFWLIDETPPEKHRYKNV
jgi:phage FluMu protein Com